MRKQMVFSATLLWAALLPLQANASTWDFSFAGPGVSGTVELTYGTATDAKYPQAFEVTGISGTFTESSGGVNIVSEIGPLEPIKHDTPDPTNLLAPHDFSNGDLSGTGTGHIDYGVAIATHDTSLDYVGGGVSVTPEPSALGLLGSGLLGMLVWRRRAS